jgi:hypothetical protein
VVEQFTYCIPMIMIITCTAYVLNVDLLRMMMVLHMKRICWHYVLTLFEGRLLTRNRDAKSFKHENLHQRLRASET